MIEAAFGEQVGVIIPMYNAARTIGETLASVSAQTWRNLDIVVVDDGSDDGSPAIVADYARRDPRVRLIAQANAGVAAARNQGAAETDADIFAFIDADDLWAPDKISAQMTLARERDGSPNVVYCWFAQIDAESRTYPVGHDHPIEGDVLRDICRENFVGNGSSLVVAREIFDRVGGFDASLRASGAQGCEDLLFLAMAARFYRFRVVTRFLLGYRLTHFNMSSDTRRMLRSFNIVAEKMLRVEPQYKTEWDDHYREMVLWLARRATMGGRIGEAMWVIGKLRSDATKVAAAFLPELISTYAKSVLVPQWAKTATRRVRLRDQRDHYLELPW